MVADAWLEMRAITVTLLVAFTCAALLVGYRRRHLAAYASIAAGVIGLAWLLVLLAVSSDWRDADGAVDCYPHCSRFQDTVAVLYWGAPAAALLLAVTAIAVCLRTQRRTG